MPADLEDLIQRAAEARRAMQEAGEVHAAARSALTAAEKRHGDAMTALTTEMRGRVDALAPWKPGDSVC